MGQCCEKLSGRAAASDSGKEVVLLGKSPLRSVETTQHDGQFTYFLGVFDLLALGEKLEMPEYIDEMHPDFSYQKFNSTYNRYQREIAHLGTFIAHYQDEHSPLNARIEQDALKISQLKIDEGLPPGKGKHGCLIKIELQDARWANAAQIGVLLQHPSSKFEKWVPKEGIEAAPVFLEFAVSSIQGAVVKVASKPGKGEIVFNLEECFKKGQQLFCKVMRWKGAGEAEGVALRVQLVSEERRDEEAKFLEMVDLHERLVREYGVSGEVSVSLNEH
jgi:hypothetical protein